MLRISSDWSLPSVPLRLGLRELGAALAKDGGHPRNTQEVDAHLIMEATTCREKWRLPMPRAFCSSFTSMLSLIHI